MLNFSAFCSPATAADLSTHVKEKMHFTFSSISLFPTLLRFPRSIKEDCCSLNLRPEASLTSECFHCRLFFYKESESYDFFKLVLCMVSQRKVNNRNLFPTFLPWPITVLAGDVYNFCELKM